MQARTGLMVLAGAGIGLLAMESRAAVVLSTDFASPTSGDGIPYTDSGVPADNGSKTVGWIGASWTVADASIVNLKQITSVTFGNFTWGSAADTIKSGEVWLTLAGGDHLDGNSSTIRFGGGLIQFNSSAVGGSTLAAEPDGTGVFNFVFEVTAPLGIKNLSASFRAGTASTSGAWNVNTAAQNGEVNVSILDATNTASGFSFYGSNQAVGAGAGPTVNAVDQTGAVLSAGTYVMQIQLSNKTRNERFSLDDFAFSAEEVTETLVPEPASLSVLGLGIAGLLMRRRR